MATFSLERQELLPFATATNKNGNNGISHQSGRMPWRWKEKKFLEGTKDQAIANFGPWLDEPGWRIVNWDTGEIINQSSSRF